MAAKELGKYFVDSVSNFGGYCNAVEYQDNGNTRLSLKPKMTVEGTMPEGYFIDLFQVKEVFDADLPPIEAHSGKPFLFNNGDKVRGTKTGLLGYVSSKVQYLNGCNLYLVTAEKIMEGKEVNLYMNENEIEIKGKPLKNSSVIPKPEKSKKIYTGGPESKSPF